MNKRHWMAAIVTTLFLGFVSILWGTWSCGTQVLDATCTKATESQDCYDGWACDISDGLCKRKCDASAPCPTGYTCDSNNLCQKDTSNSNTDSDNNNDGKTDNDSNTDSNTDSNS